MFGVIVVYPEGDIMCWTTNSVEQWSMWCHRLEDESADYFAFS